MKWFFWATIIVICFTFLIFGNSGLNNINNSMYDYNNALDAGANAAAKYLNYENSQYIDKLSDGFGSGMSDSQNIELNPGESLVWFYRIFFENLGLVDDAEKQAVLKRYMPMKAIIAFDRIMIADVNDNWVVNKPFDINYDGEMYRFTMSKQVLKLSTNEWKVLSDIGLTEEDKDFLINTFLTNEINGFLNNRENMESEQYYNILLSVNSSNEKYNDVSGVSFMAFAESMPIPSLNPENPKKFYAYGLGGTQLTRR